MLIAFSIFQLPKMHYRYIRNSVGNYVVSITRTNGVMSGGTGVHVQLPSGHIAIITNAHVCGIKDETGMVLVTSQEGRSIPRRVIEESDFTDLCLVEALPGHGGISIGSKAEAGDIVAAVGHPHLLPLTMTKGEVIGEGYIDVLDHMMGEQEDETKTCNKSKNHITEIDFLGLFKMRACLIHIKAVFSNVNILPGSSGSPIVNEYGHLVALVFAGDSSSGWGFFVTLADIEKFIASY